MNKKLIGGQKLRTLGSTRFTDDVDFMIFDEASEVLFSHNENDIINAAAHPFYSAIWEIDLNNEEVSKEALFEMSVFTFVQHCRNFNFDKADCKEFDIQFLNGLGCSDYSVAKKYMTIGEITEVEKILV